MTTTPTDPTTDGSAYRHGSGEGRCTICGCALWDGHHDRAKHEAKHEVKR